MTRLTARTIADLADHARYLRLLMRLLTVAGLGLCLVAVWDASWPWAVWWAIVAASAGTVARDVTKTLERMR